MIKMFSGFPLKSSVPLFQLFTEFPNDIELYTLLKLPLVTISYLAQLAMQLAHSAWTRHGTQCTKGVSAFTSVSTKTTKGSTMRTRSMRTRSMRTRSVRTDNGTRLSSLYKHHGRDEEIEEDNDGGSYDVKTRLTMKEAREAYIFELAFGFWLDIHEMKFFKRDWPSCFWTSK